jgi:hypothetical protein
MHEAGRTQEPQHLVHKVAAKIPEESATGTKFQGVCVVLIHRRVDPPQLTEFP